MKLRMLTGRWSFVGSLGMSALNSGPLKNISITIVVVMCYRFKGSHPIILLSIFNIWILHEGKVAITVAFKVSALPNLTRPLHPPQYLQILKAPGRAKHNGYKVHHCPPYYISSSHRQHAGSWQVLPELTPDVRELGLTTPESPPTAGDQVDVDYCDYCGVYGDF